MSQESKIYEFHISKKGRSNNPTFLRYCGCNGKAKARVESENFFSENGAQILSCDGNAIGDYVDNGKEFRYEEDAIHDTTYGRLAENLTEKEIQVIHKEGYEFELPIELRLK